MPITLRVVDGASIHRKDSGRNQEWSFAGNVAMAVAIRAVGGLRPVAGAPRE